MSEPTLSELMWRLEQVANRLEEISRTASETYVRKDVYDARHTHLTRRVDDVEREIEDRQKVEQERDKAADAFRRQVLLLVIGFAIPAVVSLLLAVNNFLVAGGATP